MNDLGTITLESDRLILRKFKIEDAEAMYNSWATDPLSNRYLEWNLHKNIEETKEIISTWIKEYDNNGYNWIVELKDTHEVIGSITGVHIHKSDLNVEIGYCYASKYWRNGYATEALKRVIDFFLNDCNMHLVEACYISGNPASGRLMEKAGMKKEAILKDRRINKDTKEFNDLIIYSITKNNINN